MSSSDTIKMLNANLATAVAHEPKAQPPSRVWKIEPVDDDWTSVDFPTNMIRTQNGKLLPDSDKTLEEELIESGDYFVVEFKEADGWVTDTQEDVQPPPITVAGRPGVPAPLFNSGQGFFDRMGKGSTSSTSLTKSDNFFSLTPSWKKTSTQEKNVEPGTLGLGNMFVISIRLVQLFTP